MKNLNPNGKAADNNPNLPDYSGDKPGNDQNNMNNPMGNNFEGIGNNNNNNNYNNMNNNNNPTENDMDMGAALNAAQIANQNTDEVKNKNEIVKIEQNMHSPSTANINASSMMNGNMNNNQQQQNNNNSSLKNNQNNSDNSLNGNHNNNGDGSSNMNDNNDGQLTGFTEGMTNALDNINVIHLPTSQAKPWHVDVSWEGCRNFCKNSSSFFHIFHIF